MMTAEQLKNSISQLALSGKLVEQRPEEGTGEVLYREIQAEKKRAIKEGKLRKQKPLPEITEDKIPFNIPNSWKWVNLGELVSVVSGVSYKKGDVQKSGVRILRGGNLSNMEVTIEEDDVFLPFEYYDLQKQVQIGDILIVASTGSKTVIGKPGFVDQDFANTMIGAFLRICRPVTLELAPFLKLIFGGAYYRKHIRDLAQGTNINNVKEEYLTNLIIPLPPLAEQKRIVAKIEELMPFVEQYAAASTKLNTLNTSFPDMMKKSILQEAVQGKLVPQDPNDEPASVLLKKIAEEKKRLIKEGKIKKQKPLPAITEDEIPFDIPESWEWVRLQDLAKQITDGEHSTPRRVNEFCGYYLLSARNIRDGRIALDDVDYVNEPEFKKICTRCNPRRGDLLISCSGSIGRCTIVDDDNNYVMVRSAAMVSPVQCDPQYLMYAIQSDCVQKQINSLKKQTAQANLFLGAIALLLIPFPSLDEQKRIVCRLNEIIPISELLLNP